MEAQNTYVNNSFEYPINPKVKPSKIVSSWGEFKFDKLDLNLLGFYELMLLKYLITQGGNNFTLKKNLEKKVIALVLFGGFFFLRFTDS